MAKNDNTPQRREKKVEGPNDTWVSKVFGERGSNAEPPMHSLINKMFGTDKPAPKKKR